MVFWIEVRIVGMEERVLLGEKIGRRLKREDVIIIRCGCERGGSRGCDG